jgi:hypothetical protein
MDNMCEKQSVMVYCLCSISFEGDCDVSNCTDNF